MQFADREQPQPHQEGSDPDAAARRKGALPPREERGSRGEVGCGRDQSPARAGDRLSRHHRAVPRALSDAASRGSLFEGEAALYDLQRRAVLCADGDQGRAFVSSHDRVPGRSFVPPRRQYTEAQHGQPPHEVPGGIRRKPRMFALCGAETEPRFGTDEGDQSGGVCEADRPVHRVVRKPPRVRGAVCDPRRKRLRGDDAHRGQPGAARQPCRAQAVGVRIRNDLRRGGHARALPCAHRAVHQQRHRGTGRQGQADDGACGKRSGVSDGVPHRHERGRIPLAQGAHACGDGGGAQACVRRHDARRTAAVSDGSRGTQPR